MAERVDPGARGERGRQSDRQGWVEDREPGHDPHRREGQLETRGVVAEHREAGDLAAGARGRGDRDRRERVDRHLVRPDQLANRDVRRRCRGGCLGGIHRASPTEADDAVVAVGSQSRRDPLHDLERRIRLDLREHAMAHARRGQGRFDAPGDRRPGEALVGDQQRVLHATFSEQRRQLGERVGPVDDRGRQGIPSQSKGVAGRARDVSSAGEPTAVTADPVNGSLDPRRGNAMDEEPLGCEEEPEHGSEGKHDIANSEPNDDLPVASRN